MSINFRDQLRQKREWINYISKGEKQCIWVFTNLIRNFVQSGKWKKANRKKTKMIHYRLELCVYLQKSYLKHACLRKFIA